jgi:protein-tyrosine kinase
MSERNEQFNRKDKIMQDSLVDVGASTVETSEQPLSDETQRLPSFTLRQLHVETPEQETQKVRTDQIGGIIPVIETPLPVPLVAPTKQVTGKKSPSHKYNKRDVAHARMLRDRCQQLCLSLFFRDDNPVRSLGFTSAIEGEGKSFLATITAQELAHDSSEPVTLIECNWEHPSLHEYFDIPPTPGLAEWLLGTCEEDDIRYQVVDNLTVIPAGNSAQDIVKLLKQVQRQGLLKLFTHQRELYIVELPPILTTGYGSLAADLLESVLVVVRAQVTTESMVAETCAQLKETSIHGIILNHCESHIPQWIRQLL